jgi:hypothetical protein
LRHIGQRFERSKIDDSLLQLVVLVRCGTTAERRDVTPVRIRKEQSQDVTADESCHADEKCGAAHAR